MKKITIYILLFILLGCTDYEKMYYDTARENDMYLRDNEELSAAIKMMKREIDRIVAKRNSNDKLSKQCINLCEGGIWVALSTKEKCGVFLMLLWTIGAWSWLSYVTRNRNYAKKEEFL